MASELYVETLKGLTSGANANKVIIPSGQTLDIDTWSPPAGSVVQTEIYIDSNATRSDQTFNTNTWVEPVISGSEFLKVTITPTSASNQIFVTFMCSMVYMGASSNLQFRLVDNNGSALGGSFSGGYLKQNVTGYYQPVVGAWLHTPGSTSAQTYKIQLNSAASASNVDFPHNGASVLLKAEEIAV